MPVRIPLFPLNTVLFPHMAAGLHIFEPRYREMIRDCRRAGTGFGVVGIRDGLEVGGPALPYSVGTLAQIRDIEDLDDGRCNLVVTGASRFRIEEVSLSRAYLTGRVVYLQDSRGDEAQVRALATRVGTVFERYRAVRSSLVEPGADSAADDLHDDDPERLSYFVAAALDIELPQRQALLEEDSAEARLRGCLRILRREVAFLDQMLTHRNRRAVHVSLN